MPIQAVYTAANATTPPAQLKLPKSDAPAALNPKESYFKVPVQVQVRKENTNLAVLVRTIALGTFREAKMRVQKYNFKPLNKGDNTQLNVKIAARKNKCTYRIEVALQNEVDCGKGVVCRGIIYHIRSLKKAALN